MIRTIYILLTFLLVLSGVAYSQGYKMVELKPIQAQGWKYYYDFKRVNSPYALQIPLQAVADAEVNTRYKRYTTFQTLRGLGYLATLIYLVTNTSYNQSSDHTLLGLFAASVGLDIGLNVIGHSQLKKATDRYNLLILSPKVGVGSTPLPNGRSYGLHLSFKLN